jgi:M6 family metalloprotease-like protein
MKKKLIKPLILLTFMLISTTILHAIPAYPDPVLVTQPDGKTLTIFVKGDERIHWYESMDGYTLLYNKDGYLSYAQLDEKGDLQPTNYIATDVEKRNILISSFLNTTEKNLFFSDAQVDLMFQIWGIEDEAKNSPKLGKSIRTICAFVQFPEKSMIKSMDEFDGLFNQLGYTTNGAVGSVRDYFKEVSYDNFDLTITLCGIYTAPQRESFFAGKGGTENVGELARWLAQKVAAEPEIDFRDFDTDNDGKVDGFHFIFAGHGKESGTSDSVIWSHKSQIQPVSQNGKRIEVYSCSPELRGAAGTNITTIGVICHEMTHALAGIRDYYDTNYDTGGQYDGTGKWDIMADGSYNGNPSGSRPAHPNMHIKMLLGWVTPIVLNSRTTVTDMPNSAENPVAYRINTTTGNEYYLLENRQRIKFDAAIPGAGLIIYHVHSNWNGVGNCINCTHPQRMYPVSARRNTQIPTAGAANYRPINSSSCPFPQHYVTSGDSVHRATFANFTIPAMLAWSGKDPGKPISEIVHKNGLISFEFMDPVVIGVDDVETDYYSSLKITPNPANEYIVLQVTSDKLLVTSIEFYNAFGQLVKSVPYCGEMQDNFITQRISITDLSKGIYLIKVGNRTAKLVVQ